MRFNTHSGLEGTHAFLSASKSAWVGYDQSKLENVYKSHLAVLRGTQLHELAANLIKMGVKLPKSRKTLNLYVNDALGYRMTPEQVLFYSVNCYGTADAISFRDGLLRIHDLKTGVVPASLRQLEVYAALFCLEYQQKPGEIGMELRIYQNDDVLIHEPDVDSILHIIDRIKTFDKVITKLRGENE